MTLFRSGLASTARQIKLARQFSPYLAPLRHWIAVSVALSLLLPPIGGAILWLVKAFVDNIIVGHRFSILPMLAVGFVVASAAKVTVDFVAIRLEAWIAETIIYRLRADLYRHVMMLSPGSLVRHSTGDFLARLESDVQRAEILLYTAPALVFADAVAAVFFTAVLFAINWHLSLASLLAFRPLPWWLRTTLLASAEQHGSRVTGRRRGLASLRKSWLRARSSMPSVTAEAEAQRFATACAAVRKAELLTVTIEAQLNLAIEAAVMFGGFLVAAAGAYEIWIGKLESWRFSGFSRRDQPAV